MQSNRATFALIVNGTDYAAAIAPHLFPGTQPPRDAAGNPAIPRLMGLQLSEKLEGEADELNFTLSDHDRKLAPIVRGAELTLSLGWQAGVDVVPGLVSKGRFRVDEVSRGGPPDIVEVRARSADLTGDFRRRRDKGWKGKTLRDVVGELANASGLEPAIHADLASKLVRSMEQSAKSDAAFLNALGKQFDAVATVKDGRLIFMPIGSSTTAVGSVIPSISLTRGQCSNWRFTVADRQEHDGAEAQWDDRGAARKRTVTSGAGKNPRRIKRKFGSEAEATDAAAAAAKRAKRGQFNFDYTMALGDPAITPNQSVALAGWDEEIDPVSWLVEEATHSLDAGAGLTSSLKLVSVGG